MKMLIKCLLSASVGLMVGIWTVDQSNEQDRRIILLSAKEETTGRCADWTKAKLESMVVRNDGATEYVYKCPEYSFFIVQRLNMSRVSSDGYNTTILKQLAEASLGENRW